MTTLLVVDDDPPSCRLLSAIFGAEGMKVVAVHDGPEALVRFEELQPDAVLLDLQLPSMDGLEVLSRMRDANPHTPVVMLTADRDVKTAVRAIQRGAIDYLAKPIDHDEIVLVVQRALERRALEHEVIELRRRVGDGGSLVEQMGHSAEIQRIVQQVGMVAATGFSVLVTGETGTGKELVAQAIHRESPRRAQAFIALDCGAIPEPLLESELFGHEQGAFTGAHASKKASASSIWRRGARVFLDEIGELPIWRLQVEAAPGAAVTREFERARLGTRDDCRLNVRLITATNKDLEKAMRPPADFREDLYYPSRMQFAIAVPAATRAASADILQLARITSLEKFSRPARARTVQADRDPRRWRHARACYHWPGNVRELRNAIRQAVLETTDGVLQRASVARFVGKAPAPNAHARPAERSLKEAADAAAREAERAMITETLRATSGNKSQAARALRTDYKTLHVKMKTLGIRARDFIP